MKSKQRSRAQEVEVEVIRECELSEEEAEFIADMLFRWWLRKYEASAIEDETAAEASNQNENLPLK